VLWSVGAPPILDHSESTPDYHYVRSHP